MLVNGIDNGDWYGFVNWGFPIGIGIFSVICLMSFVLGVILEKVNRGYINSISSS